MANPLDLLKDLAAKFAGIEGALAKITAAEDRAKALDSELATAKQATTAALADLDAERASHSETKAALQKAQEEVNSLGASLAAEKQRANETIASQGLTPDQVPAGSTGSGEPKTNAWQRYQSLLATDPKAAGEFYAANADAVLSNRPK